MKKITKSKTTVRNDSFIGQLDGSLYQLAAHLQEYVQVLRNARGKTEGVKI